MYTYLNYRHKSDNSYFSASFYSLYVFCYIIIVIHISVIPGADPGIFVGGRGGGAPKHFETQKKENNINKQIKKGWGFGRGTIFILHQNF